MRTTRLGVCMVFGQVLGMVLGLLLCPLGVGCSDGGEDPGDGGTADAPRDDAEQGDGATTDQQLTPDAGQPGTFSKVASFGSNPGQLVMYKYVPTGMPKSAPLVLALHGCGQTAQAFAADTGYNDLADARKFYVVYPQQTSSNNPATCFNWFLPQDAGRDKGEAMSIRQMLDKMAADHGVDSSKIFVTGLSAGAALAVALAAAYPDRFAGGAIQAGIPAGCATDVFSGQGCMKGVDKTPKAWGDLARAAFPAHKGAWPRMIIFHGSADSMVSDANLQELVDQWTNLHGADQTPETSDKVGGHPHRVYKDGQGQAVVESYHLQGMGHGIAVDPGPGQAQGGKTSIYAYDVNLWSSYYAAQFWGLGT